MVDIAAKLATDFLEAQGWTCILITGLTARVQCIVTVGGIDARNEPGCRIWLARKHVDRVLEALFSRCQQARRRARGGLTVGTDVAAAEQQIRAIADSFGYAVSDDAVIDEQLTLVRKRIGIALDRMQNDGSMKVLNKQYAAERKAAKGPLSYTAWLTDRLRPAIQAGLG